MERVESPRAQPGTGAAPDGLASTIYAHLRAIAQNQMLGERVGHTLTATALVHEAFMRVGDDPRVKDMGRASYLRVAAEAMRRILIEHARSRGRVKRGGGVQRIPLEAIGDVADLGTIDQDGGERIFAFDAAFERLEAHEPVVADVVRLRFYAGLSVPETALALAISERTVNNYWAYARAWLAREMQTGEEPGPA